MTDREILDRLGNLVARIRDELIDLWDRKLEGKMLGEDSVELHARVREFSPQQLETLRWAFPQVIDTALYEVLDALDNSNEFRLVATIGDEQRDVGKISDGLATELQTADGWIMRFSRARKTTQWAK